MSRNNFKTRNFLLELYPDNQKHQAAFDFILASDFEYAYILHHITDIDGQEIMEGDGKPHYHVILTFINPVYASALARKLGLITDLGDPDLQFLQHVKDLDNALLYLTHVKYEDKEHYNPDEIKGSRFLRLRYDKAFVAWLQNKRITVREGLWAIRDYINHQNCRITADMFVRWIVRTPYLRFRNEKLVHQMIAEHNDKYQTYTNLLDQYARGQIELNRRSGMVAGSDIGHLEYHDEYGVITDDE